MDLYTEENKQELIKQYELLDYQFLTKEQIATFITNEVLRVYQIGFDFGRKFENLKKYSDIVNKNKDNDSSTKEG